MDNCAYSLDSDARSAQQRDSSLSKVVDDKCEQGALDSAPKGLESGHNESKQSSQIESVDKSGLSRQSHYIAGS